MSKKYSRRIFAVLTNNIRSVMSIARRTKGWTDYVINSKFLIPLYYLYMRKKRYLRPSVDSQPALIFFERWIAAFQFEGKNKRNYFYLTLLWFLVNCLCPYLSKCPIRQKLKPNRQKRWTCTLKFPQVASYVKKTLRMEW